MNEIDLYIDSFHQEVQEILNQLRRTIIETAPDAVESFAYGMPAYKLNGRPLVYFAGYKSHIGFYATPTGHEKFAKELSKYKQGKGSVQFPVKDPLPIELIRRMVEFRVTENMKKNK